jgi:hypothetical protein
MGNNMETWKILEDLMIELRRKGVEIPASTVNDLRSAKLMIQLSCTDGSKGETSVKAEEILGNIEAHLMTEAEKTLGEKAVDEWLRRLDEAGASCTVCTEKPSPKSEDKFVTGVPRDQKWVRVEPVDNLSAERIEQIAQQRKLSVNPQKDGRLVVFGQPEDIKAFLKTMTAEAAKK